MATLLQEKFPNPAERELFKPLWDAHGVEVSGVPFRLKYDRYEQIDREGRLIWIVSRETVGGPVIGYSCHWWYLDMHWEDRIVGVDDLWYVVPHWRNAGVGGHMKKLGLDLLRSVGAIETSDAIRFSGTNAGLMTGMGYVPWGLRWKKRLGRLN